MSRRRVETTLEWQSLPELGTRRSSLRHLRRAREREWRRLTFGLATFWAATIVTAIWIWG